MKMGRLIDGERKNSGMRATWVLPRTASLSEIEFLE
jgi:hypothetical protein